MKFRGKIWKFGDNVDTDAIIPARHLTTTDPAELARHCMEDLDAQFAGNVGAGDIIVAGENFGCGSSREHAPIAIQAAGIACVVARSFARIFYRNAFNMGLPIFESAELWDRVTGDSISRWMAMREGSSSSAPKLSRFPSSPYPPSCRSSSGMAA